MVVSRLLLERAERLGDRLAIDLPAGSLSYVDLADAACRVGNGLRTLGVSRGDRVATFVDGASSDYIAMWLGTAASGAAEVPLNPELKGELLRHILTESEPTLIVVQDKYVERLDGLGAGSSIPRVVVGDTATHRPADAPFDEVRTCEPNPIDISETDTLHVMYTSGTTGRSKGVIHTNRSALTNTRTALNLIKVTSEDICYCYFPLFHVTGRMFAVMSSLWVGGRAHLTDRFSVTTFWKDVAKTGGTWTVAVGGVLQLLYAKEEADDDRRHSLKLICSGRVPPQIHLPFEQRFGLELLDIYGLTEAGTLIGQRRGEPKVIGTVGRQVPRFEVAIHDENDEPVPVGTTGEICVRPREPGAMFSGYWRQPEATLDAFRNLWFHTGDAGVEEPDGTFRIVDRLKDSIRRLGENVSAFEVEAVINEHPAVQESAAYPAHPEQGDEEVMVAVVVKPGATLEPSELRTFAEERLPRYAAPRFLRVMTELPKTHSQRVEKYRLREAGITPDTVDLSPRAKRPDTPPPQNHAVGADA
jgi:crotonobetaine/carnitine-CoA ligase